jgi:hypothetical protein
MTRLLKTILVAVAVMALGTGCMMVSNSTPQVAVPLQEVTTKATYDIIGPAQGESTGAYVLGIIPVKGENKTGAIGTSLNLRKLYSPVQRAAIYNAIESVPTADALLAPRFQTTVTKNLFLFKEETVTVRGKAIRFNTSAK